MPNSDILVLERCETIINKSNRAIERFNDLVAHISYIVTNHLNQNTRENCAISIHQRNVLDEFVATLDSFINSVPDYNRMIDIQEEMVDVITRDNSPQESIDIARAETLCDVLEALYIDIKKINEQMSKCCDLVLREFVDEKDLFDIEDYI